MLTRLREHLSLADVLLILAVIAAIIVSAVIFLKKDEERFVHIYKDNLAVGVFPLNQDRVIRIDEHNTVQIKDGKVRMLQADCPDQRCVKQGAGDVLPLVCLPNRVVVEIRSRSAERGLIVQ
ncbi:MAG: NusG domain II-containing protein [Candidatus Cloacimonetes bacterium]|nr:NusG domain II-containing protein [Candidatus Cloacimonadota bacterium]